MDRSKKNSSNKQPFIAQVTGGGGGDQTKPKVSRRNEITNIRVKHNERENRNN